MTINYKNFFLATAVTMNFAIAADATTSDENKPTTITFSGNFKTESKKGDTTTSTVDIKLSGDHTKSPAETAWNFFLDIITTGSDAVELHISGKGSHKADPASLVGSVAFKDGVDLDADVKEKIGAAFKGKSGKVDLWEALGLLGMKSITTSSSRSSRVIDTNQDVNGIIQALINADMPITIREILAQLGLTPLNAAAPKAAKASEEAAKDPNDDRTAASASATPMATSETDGQKAAREEDSDTLETTRAKSHRTEASE